MSTTTVAAGTSTTMSMKGMRMMTVAADMSIMCPVTPMTANASFAIPTKSIVMFVAKA